MFKKISRTKPINTHRVKPDKPQTIYWAYNEATKKHIYIVLPKDEDHIEDLKELTQEL